MLSLGGKFIEVLPTVHTVPAVGFAVSAGQGQWVFSGDTERNPAFWERVNAMDVAMRVIETAFSNREQVLARQSLHLSPCVLADELDCIAQGKKFSVYFTPAKPAETEVIMSEIQRFDQHPVACSGVAHDIRWLRAGQEFEV